MGNAEHTLPAGTRPLLRWAGSKKKVLPKLLDLVPPSYDRYIEPFAGSACLFFRLLPSEAVLGDTNQELIGMYRTVRHRPDVVMRAVRSLPTTAQSYYEQRDLLPSSLNAVQRAARFIYLNRMCFNGVYRINRRGQFNVPMGSRTGRLPSDDEVNAAGTGLL